MTNLSWQAEDVLTILREFNLRPGRNLPVKTLWHKMGKGKDVAIGIEALVTAGYVEVNKRQTDIVLTEEGYRKLRQERSLGGAKPEAEPTPEALTASRIPRKAVILTALEVETKAVLRHLTETNEVTVKHTAFHVGEFGSWEIAVVECGAGNARAASTVERAIHHFNPEVACFVGVAGGVKDVTIGDIVVASKVYGYEGGKEGKRGFSPRPEISLPAYAFEQRARAIRLKAQWRTRLDGGLNHVDPEIHVGALAAGEKVVASTRGTTAHLLRANYSDALGVEMEGRGFLDGIYINNHVQGCLVRGISDLLDKKEQTDKDGCQKIAADAASAVIFELLHTLPAFGAAQSATIDYTIAELARDDVPDVRVADDPGVRSMFEDGERDKLLPLLAAGKLQAWGRRGNGFPPLSAISGDHWNSHFLEYHSAPTGGINQTFLKVSTRPYESDYYDVHLNREQLRRVWHDRLDFVYRFSRPPASCSIKRRTPYRRAWRERKAITMLRSGGIAVC
jgi:nucleoside phosphorylase